MAIAQRVANGMHTHTLHCWLGVNPVGGDGGVVAGRTGGLAVFVLGEIL